MVNPILGCVRGKGKVGNDILVDFVVEVEEDTEAGMCKDGMRRFWENVIARQTFFSCCESLRCQVLFDREMR
jgi:hypothetical protein